MISKMKGLSFQGMKKYLKESNGILLAIYLFFVIFTSFFINWNGESAPLFTMLCIVVFGGLLFICPFLLKKMGGIKIKIRERYISRKQGILCYVFFFFLSFCFFILWYLSYYPGAFSSDAIYQYEQVVSGQYNNWKPILQTLLTFTFPWKLTGRVDMIVFFQIVEYSCVLAYMAWVIWKHAGMHIAIPALLYILLNPVTGNIIVCPWKDVTFAMFAVWLMTFGVQVHITDGSWLESKGHRVLFSFVLVVTTFLRHNAFLFTLPLFIAVAFRIERKKRIRIMLFFLICSGLIEICLYPMVSVEEQWYPKARVMGVPMTILGNAAKEAPESLDPETEAFVYSVASKDVWENVYRSGSFNSVKWNSNQKAIDEKGMLKVVSMAARTLCRAPQAALKGLFELTDIVYGLDDNLDWTIQPSMGENTIGLEFRESSGREKLEDYTKFSRTGILKYLFWYIGVVNVLLIAAGLCKCRFHEKREWNKILFVLPILVYNFGTMLLLSGNDFRYFYLNYPMCPIVLLSLLGEKTDSQERKKGRIFAICKAGISFIISKWKEAQRFLKESIKKINFSRKIRIFMAVMKRLLAIFFPIATVSDKIYVVFSFVLSCVIVMGDKINVYEKPYFEAIVFQDFIDVLISFLIIFIVGNILLTIIKYYLVTLQSVTTGKRWWLGAFVLLTLLWLPYLLAYYPGILTADSFTSLLQAKDLSLLYNHIPVMYTLMVALFTRIGWSIGDANFGIFLFSFVQLLVMAGVLSYLAYWVRMKVRKAFAAWLVLLFYGLNLTMAMYSITMWKDVLFSAWIALLCLFLFDVALENGKILEERKGLKQLCILFALISFGRNNGIYVVVFCWFILLLFYKHIRKKIFLWGGSTILIILLIQGPGYKICGIDQSGFAESVGIPLQQISYTSIYDGPLQETEREFLEKIIPLQIIEEDYSPVSADNIKFNAEFNTAFFEQNKADFIKMYFKLLPEHFGSYVESYLLSTSGFWKIEETGWLVGEGIYENDMGFYTVDYLKQYTNIDMKEGMSDRITHMRQSLITNVGIMVWLVFLYTIVCFRQRQSWKAYLALPLIGCWLTIMIATPVFAQFRYIYYYHIMLPVICVMLFMKREESKE